MTLLRDKIYLWGQNAGTHHLAVDAEGPNHYKLPGVNKMTSAEGCRFFGIRNCCRVVSGNLPDLPWDDDTRELSFCKEIIWSALGAGGTKRNNEGQDDTDEIIRLAKIFPNVTGAVLDDFLCESRMKLYPVDSIRRIRDKLHTGAGRKLDLWLVFYEREMGDMAAAQPYLDLSDVVTFWTWYGKNLPQLEANLAAARQATQNRLMAGCYMWNYGESKPLTRELMQHQLDVYYRHLKDGLIDGVILCSNCIADLGIPEVEQTRLWIEQHGDEEI